MAVDHGACESVGEWVGVDRAKIADTDGARGETDEALKGRLEDCELVGWDAAWPHAVANGPREPGEEEGGELHVEGPLCVAVPHLPRGHLDDLALQKFLALELYHKILFVVLV